MEISSWTCKQGNGQAGQMVRISREEALLLIKSLTEQLLEGTCNGCGRLEQVDQEGRYFSIAVVEPKPPTPVDAEMLSTMKGLRDTYIAPGEEN